MRKITNTVATEQRNTSQEYILPGNITPHEWYSTIVDESGKPNFRAISILADIVAQYRFARSDAPCSFSRSLNCDLPVLVGKSLRLSYEYFANKLYLKKEQTRRSLVFLEELGVLSRDVCNISLENTRCNKLLITLDQAWLKSCFRDPKKDIRARKKNSDSFDDSDEIGGSKLSESSIDGNKIQCPQKCHHPLSNKKINKNRSTDFSSFEDKSSNFCKSSSLEKKGNGVVSSSTKTSRTEFDSKEGTLTDKSNNLEGQGGCDKERTKITSNSDVDISALPPRAEPFGFYKKPKCLEEFYPLSSQDAKELQYSSGREFSLNATNEILKDISKKLSNRLFKSKKGFMSYMSKILANEMRDAVKVSNESFKIKANLSELEKTEEEEEKYLTQVEYSLEVSPELHLKKKLAATLERSKAYKILRSYRSSVVEGGIFKMKLGDYIDLTKVDRENILSQVKATHERFSGGTLEEIESLDIVMPSKQEIQNTNQVKAKKKKQLPEGMWGKVRAKLISQYGEDIDNNWFSKLEAQEEEESQSLKLSAPSGFVGDWVRQNYQFAISKIVNQLGFKLEAQIC